ncbi:hypothetical protein FRB90_004575 [Tulasnella sp. 427]|nr:hypothetical protein FRB90_004575 [Tulasnella sp. 427]
MAEPHSMENLFSSSMLEVVVPDGAFELPEPFSAEGATWLRTLTGQWRGRDVAFYDERLSFILCVNLPIAAIKSAIEDSSPEGQLDALLQYFSHLQVSLEASYVPPATEDKPPTLTISPPNRLQASGSPRPPGRASPSVIPPLTPLPVPSTSAADAPYANPRTVESGPLVHAYMWGERDNVTDRTFTIVKTDEKLDGLESWVAVFRLEVPVAFIQTWFHNPQLCLTVSTTLRERKLPQTSQRRAIIQAFTDYATTLPTSPELPKAKVVVKNEHGLADGAMNGFEEVNLLEGVATGMTFTAKTASEQPLVFPTSRLSDSIRSNSFLLNTSTSSSAQRHQRAPSTPSSAAIVFSQATLRKSYRKVLRAVSGIRVRMRTTFVPYLSIPSSNPDSDDPDERKDAGNEEKTVILSVEVENVAESGRGFEVEKVDVTVGGEGAKATLIGWGEHGPGKGDAEALFPLRLKSADLYNLLYAVTFISLEKPGGGGSTSWPTNNSLIAGGARVSDAQRPMSIVVTGRPWDPNAPPDFTLPPVKTFPARWSSLLDLTQSSIPSDRPPSPTAGGKDALPIPPSPFPSGSPFARFSIGADSVFQGSAKRDSALQSPVAGSKRHTVSGLAALSERLGFNKKRSSNPAAVGSAATSRVPSPISIGHPPHLQGRYSQLPSPHTGTVGSLSIPPTPAGPLPPPTPAFPSYSSAESTVPPSPMAQSPISGPRGPGPVVEPSRSKLAGGPSLPSTPVPQNRFSQPLSTNLADGNALLVSVSLVPPVEGDGDGDDDVGDDDEREWIYPSDHFSLDIFVFNKSNRMRRFEISYPERKRWRKENQAGPPSARDSRANPAFEQTAPVGVMPLENHINIGPLQPDSCQSVRMKFVALRSGVHSIDALNVRDVESNKSTNLRSVMHVVVHERSSQAAAGSDPSCED